MSTPSLPTELWRLICRKLDAVSLASFIATNSAFQSLTIPLWRRRLEADFPRVASELPAAADAADAAATRLYAARVTVARQATRLLGGLALDCLHRSSPHVSHECVRRLLCQFAEQPHAELFLWDHLLTFLDRHVEGHEQMTGVYYARKILLVLNQRRVLHSLQGWNDKEEKTTIEGALLVSQWHQTTNLLNLDSVETVITELAEGAKEFLRQKSKRHPALREGWDGTDVVVAEEVVAAVGIAFAAHRPPLTGNVDEYYDPLNSFLDQVLLRGKGIPITLCVLFSAVLGRLGVDARPANIPSHVMLRWARSADDAFIDAFDGGKILSLSEVRAKLGIGDWEAAGATMQPTEVLRRMSLNLAMVFGTREYAIRVQVQAPTARLTGSVEEAVVAAQRLACALQTLAPAAPEPQAQALHIDLLRSLCRAGLPDDAAELARLAFPHQEEMAAKLQRLVQEQEDEESEEKAPKLRDEGENNRVSFRLGQIMRHRRYGYRCVIRGWDGHCALSVEWQTQMGVGTLPDGPDQPFYNVLADDHSDRYAAQENLELSDDATAVDHPELGKYFDAFRPQLRAYSPNASLQAFYPHDVPMAQT